MNTFRKILVAQFPVVSLILITLLGGCAAPESASPESAARGQQGKLLQSAVRHFAQLKQQDRLPGIRREEHGSLTTKALPLREGDISYPASVRIRATKNGDDSTYSYRLLKESESSPWQLVKASRLDKDGKLLEELPVKRRGLPVHHERHWMAEIVSQKKGRHAFTVRQYCHTAPQREGDMHAAQPVAIAHHTAASESRRCRP